MLKITKEDNEYKVWNTDKRKYISLFNNSEPLKWKSEREAKAWLNWFTQNHLSKSNRR